MRRIEISPPLRSTFIEQFYLRSTAARPPLRIGVFVDGAQLISPFAIVLDQIQRSNFARLELVVRNGLTAAAAPASSSLPRRLWKLLSDSNRRGKLAFGLYSRWDQKHHPREAQVLSLVDCSQLFADIENVMVEPIVKGFVHRFPDDVTRLVRDRDLDVILRFGFNIIRGEILHSARYGMWSYHHGDNDYYRGGPSHFWEMYENNPCLGVILQVLNEELDNGLILDKAITSSNSWFSQTANRMRPYLMGTHMVIRALHDLHEHGWDFVRQRAFSAGDYRGRRKIYRMPDNAEVSRFVLSRVNTWVSRRLRFSGRNYHWRMACRRLSEASALPDRIDGFQWIESPRDRFYADPFLVSRNDQLWVFFEEYLYPERRGRISCAELRPDGRLGEVVPVLDEPSHLSYPFVFEHNGEIFMIPESMSKGSVDLYHATVFPYQWKKVKTLLDTGGLDTTIHEQDGKLWLFTSVFDPPSADYTLLLFFADDLFGEWRFHPANPITTDVRKARNAGAFVVSGGQVIRPSQDCSVRYGYALGFQAITRLNPCEYAETSIRTLLPPESENIFGIHSYARSGGFEMIDGQDIRRL